MNTLCGASVLEVVMISAVLMFVRDLMHWVQWQTECESCALKLVCTPP